MRLDWTPNFAYAIGLIATDGNLSNDGRHIDFTSKDLQLIRTFKKSLSINNAIGRKARGGEVERKYYRVQFGDRNFYDFLNNIGLYSAKSKSISSLKVPKKYFADFLRGCIDGDGNINIFKHPESTEVQLKIRIFSASRDFLEWIEANTKEQVEILGGWIESSRSLFQLC